MVETLERIDSPVDVSLSTVSRVYCGLSKPNGESVSESDLARFIRESVSRLFPDGFTVLRANGGWRDLATGQTIQEPSAVFELAHGGQDMPRVLELARDYKRQFGQQAVMVASVPVTTQFV